jgi:hypothetical protein
MTIPSLTNFRLFSLLCLAALLAGCASSTPIQRYSESQSKFSKGVPVMSTKIPQSDWYRVFVQGATGFVPMSALREDVEDRAEKFCQRQNKEMILLGERTQYPYLPGQFPRIEIVFATVEKK